MTGPVAVETDVGGDLGGDEGGIGDSVDIEFHAGQAGIEKGLEEGVAAFEKVEGSDEDGPRLGIGCAVKFKANRVRPVFEQMDPCLRCEFLEMLGPPWGFDGEGGGAGEDGFFGAGLDAGEEGHAAGRAAGGQDSLNGDEQGFSQVIRGEGVSLLRAPAVEEVGLKASAESGDLFSFPPETGQNFNRESAAREKVEGLAEVADFAIGPGFLGAGDPVDVEVGVIGKLPGQGVEPSGMMADGAVLKARKAVNREVSGKNNPHDLLRKS